MWFLGKWIRVVGGLFLRWVGMLFLEIVKNLWFLVKWIVLVGGMLFAGGLSAREWARLMGWPVELAKLGWPEFSWMLALFSLGGGVAASLWGLANRRKPRWGLGLVVLALILFGLFVWPTPFKDYKGPGDELVKVHRVTGKTEVISPRKQ